MSVALWTLGAVLLATPGEVSWNLDIEIDLAAAAGNAEVALDAPTVWVTRDAVMIEYVAGGARRAEVVVPIKGGQVDPAFKNGGRTSLLIQPLLDALRDLLRAPGGTGPINLHIDRTTPYRVVADVLYTAGQAGFDDFRLGILDSKRSAILLTGPRFKIAPAEPYTLTADPDTPWQTVVMSVPAPQ